MRKISLLTIALLIGMVFSLQTASAQFPVKIKIPKPSQPKPQATSTDTTQPAPDTSAQPAQPRPDNRSTAKPAGGAATGKYPKRTLPTDSPLFLAETLDISCETQDYYWKAPKVSNYTSWIPSLRFNVIYEGSSRLRYKAEYFMPDGSPWYSESLDQRGVLIVSEDVSDKHNGKAQATAGTFGVKITNLRDSGVVFQGKFKVVKYKPTGNEGDKYFFDFYVDQDWNLPVGYAALDWSEQEVARPYVRMWFKGRLKPEDLEARLYYNGQQIATTDDGGSVAHLESRYPKRVGNDASLQWDLYETNWSKKLLFITDEHARQITEYNDTRWINSSPGDYTVKVFYKGEQVRETKFTVADGDLLDNGIAKQNHISTDKEVIPVKVMGNVEKWNALAWKTDAFYGNPLTGFEVP